jgi:signal transduction histidine kinase
LHNLKKAQFDEREQASFTKLSQLIDESLMGIKEISNNLSPHVLRNFGLVNALNVFIEKVASVSEAKIHYKFDAGQKYNEIVELTLYRVVTELINNTIKHAQAKNIYIELLQKEKKLQLIYADDGKGFDSEHIDKPGLGILNIKSRIKSIAGKIDFDASVGKGVKVVIETNI